MRQIIGWRVLIPMGVLLVSPPIFAQMQVVIGAPALTVTDNGPGDGNPAANTINFVLAPAGSGWIASGNLIQVVGGGAASLTLTDFTIVRVPGGAVGGILVPCAVQTAIFPVIGPPSIGSASLAGTFVDAAVAGNVAIDMFANAAGQPIGPLIGPFTSPPAAFAGANGPVALARPVNMLDMLLSFTLTDVGDLINLPMSAEVKVSKRQKPTPSEWGLIVFGVLLLASLVWFIWRKRKFSLPQPN
ncbi:MAG: hypothetical protein ACT4QB_14055 [Gammaproteobacteria bacterium]